MSLYADEVVLLAYISRRVVRLLAVLVDWQAVQKATVSRQAAILIMIFRNSVEAFDRVFPDGLYNYYILIPVGKYDFCWAICDSSVRKQAA